MYSIKLYRYFVGLVILILVGCIIPPGNSNYQSPTYSFPSRAEALKDKAGRSQEQIARDRAAEKARRSQ
jgi:hypothetical protein